MRQSSFTPKFVETVPEAIEEGVLYISTRFRTATHLCACGCASRVVTPIKPAKWRFTYDGETVSLHPSIGRWQLPCKSHYWIRCNQVVWSREFDDQEIAEVLQRDSQDLHDYYQGRAATPRAASQQPSRWARLRRRLNVLRKRP